MTQGKPTFILTLLVVLCGLGISPGAAFHDGGVAHCDGCHTMHNSDANPADNPAGNPFLLLESTPTDVCLRCHESSLGNTWGTDVLDPGDLYGGGQFVFLQENNLKDGYDGGHSDPPIPGHRAGHSVISADKGTSADPDNTVSPGGDYDSSQLHCTSCHDPHGRGSHFRLLYGNDYPESFANGYTFLFTSPAPDATGVSVLGSAESNSHHTAFRSGSAEWCGNCHGSFHNESYPSVLKHPTGVALGPELATSYNAYNGSGSYDAVFESAYLALVPFEDPGVTVDSTEGPSASSRVACISCHRAHASSAPYSGRWDFNISVWEEEGLPSGSFVIPNPYPATAGDLQRSLCNKCHAKDPELKGSPGICSRCHDIHG